MKMCKRILCAFLSLLMVIGMAEIACVSAFADETDNQYRFKFGEDISGNLNAVDAGELVQNHADLDNNQLIISASGSTLKLSGKTTLPLLPELEGYIPIFVTSFICFETGVFDGPYIAMTPVENTDENGEKYYSFSGEYDFSDVNDGTYKMYLWRGYKEENRLRYKMGLSLNGGILHWANIIKVSNGAVKVLKYNKIAAANADAYSKMNVYSAEDFLDTAMGDFTFANKNPKVADDKGSYLTSEQQRYIADVAAKITKNCTTDYDKIRKIYEYVATNVYYDENRPFNVGTNVANSNPYENIKGIEEKTSNGYNIENGKVATNCVGYSAMVASLSRSLGIPARIINGVHNSEVPWDTTDNLNNQNHHWAECYVNGRWIMADADAGTQNSLKSSGWSYTGLSNYTYFDPTDDEIANGYIVKSLYRREPVPDELSAPTISYSVNSTGSFTISWDKVTGADKYELYYSTDNGETYHLKAEVESLAVRTGKSAFGVVYKYKVRAVSTLKNIKSEYSNVIDAVNNEYLDAPEATYSVNSDRTFTISWDRVIGADKYEVYAYNTSTGKYYLSKTTTDTSINTGTAPFGTTYKYVIKAVNSTNNVKSPDSNVVSAVNNQYLAAPTVNYTLNSDRTLTVSWNKITGADKYEVYYSSDGGKTYNLKTTTTATSVKSGQVAFGSGFRYKVRAVNSANNIKSAYSNVVNAVNDKYLPAPTATYAVNTDRTLTVSWNKITGADKYEVYYSGDGGKTYNLKTTTTATSVKSGQVAYGSGFRYKVRAVNSANNIKSDFSNVVNAVNNKYLPAPTVKYTVNTDRTLTVSWNKVTGADKYEVYYSTDGGNTYKLKSTTTATSVKSGQVAFGGGFRYKVRVVNSANNIKSAYSNVVNAVNDKYLAAPTATYAVNTDRTLTVSWNKVTGADKYEVYYSTDGGNTYKLKSTTTATSVKSGQVAFGSGFRYKVRAVNSANNIKSAYSNVVNAVNNKYLAAPTVEYAVNADCTLTISWNKVTGADKYEVYYSADGGNTYKLKTTTTATSVKSGQVAYGNGFRYKVRAVNSANNIKSAYSNVVNAVNNVKLTAPSAKLAVNTNDTFTISWNKVTGATKYEIYRYNSAKQQFILSSTTTDTSITTGKASKGITYQYKVRAITSKDASATSDFSAVVLGQI